MTNPVFEREGAARFTGCIMPVYPLTAGITNHLLAADVDMTREEYNKLRGGSVREVTSTRGTILLRDVISDSQE